MYVPSRIDTATKIPTTFANTYTKSLLYRTDKRQAHGVPSGQRLAMPSILAKPRWRFSLPEANSQKQAQKMWSKRKARWSRSVTIIDNTEISLFQAGISIGSPRSAWTNAHLPARAKIKGLADRSSWWGKLHPDDPPRRRVESARRCNIISQISSTGWY